MQNQEVFCLQEVFCEKSVPKNLAKFAGKHLCLKPATLLKKRLWRRCLPVNFAKLVHSNYSKLCFLTCIILFFVKRLYPLSSTSSLILLTLFLYKKKRCKNKGAEIRNKRNNNKLRTFWGWKVQKQKIKITMIYISLNDLIAEEWPEIRQFSWGLKGALSGLRQFLTAENLLKVMKTLFVSP